MASARLLRPASLLMIIVGVVISIVSIVQGQMQVILFLIFPVFYAEEVLPAIGTALLFIGIVGLFLSFFVSMTPSDARSRPNDGPLDLAEAEERRKPKMKSGGVVLIGPVPIIFGSDWRMAITAIVLAILLVGMMLLFLL
ncbi:MAG: DUF131 domain-containing protein [Methanomassiliicoccales archaeon]